MKPLPNHPLLTILFLSTLTFFPIATSVDTLSAAQNLTSTQTLTSTGEIFELAIFEPDDGSDWYLGIRYKKIPDKKVVWVANRDTPLSNSSATLQFDNLGKLVLVDHVGNIKWSANQTSGEKPILQLLDSGNLVVREANDNDPEKFLWQSFDYPTDTLLPNMKLGCDLNKGLDRYISSWKSQDDPSTGDYSFRLDYHGFPEIFLRNKQVSKYRSGPWNGERFSGVPEMAPVNGLEFSFVTNQDEVYYSFHIETNSLISRLAVTPEGKLERYTWR